MLHFKLSPLNGLVGVSPLRSLLSQRQNMDLAAQTERNYFNTPLQKYVITLQAGAVDPEGKEHISEVFDESLRNGARSNLVMDQTMNLTELNHQSDKNLVQLLDSINTASKKDIATVYGIPTDWLGVESQHNNNDQAKGFYIEHTLASYMAAITSELNQKLGATFKYDLSRLLNTNVQAQSEMTLNQLNSGLITVNEARKMLNLPPVDGGNTLASSGNDDTDKTDTNKKATNNSDLETE